MGESWADTAMQSDHSIQLLHWLNQPPSFALGGKGSPRSQSVIPAHIVRPSSRLPLDVQPLLEPIPPGSSVPPTPALIRCITILAAACSAVALLWASSPALALVPLVPPAPTLIPCLLSLLVLLALLAATAAPVGAPHSPLLLLLPPRPVCARTP